MGLIFQCHPIGSCSPGKFLGLGVLLGLEQGLYVRFVLKEYYEIVDEARPLSGFFPTHADLFTEMHY